MGDLEKQEKVVMGGTAEEEENELLLEGMAVSDFDILCSTVALQTQQGKWGKLDRIGEDEGGDSGGFGGIFRMWEGELLNVFDDRRIALESAWFVL